MSDMTQPRPAQAGRLTRIAGEPIRAGDLCRRDRNGTASRIRDGQGVKTTDWIALHDADVGEIIHLRRIQP